MFSAPTRYFEAHPANFIWHHHVKIINEDSGGGLPVNML